MVGFFSSASSSGMVENAKLSPTKDDPKRAASSSSSSSTLITRNRTRPLSTQLLQQVSGLGMCCSECGKMNGLASWTKETDGEKSSWTEDENLRTLQRQQSSVSPLVLGPMTLPLADPSVIEGTLADYIAACRFYGVTPNAGVLTTVRFGLPSLRVSGSFFDADMLSLGEVLLKHANGALRYIHRLDFSIASKEGKLHGKAGFRSHGALCLSKVLQMSEHVREVYLQRNRIGPYGASAIFIACATNTYLETLLMRRCSVGERGALAFAELVICSNESALTEVDLSANKIGYKGSVAIEQALEKRVKDDRLHLLNVDMEGNLVYQEIMNGVTHGLGILLAIVGASLLSKRVQHESHRHVVSCAVYSTSLLILYSSSTLYHSFVTLKTTKYIFEVMDKCAIYILIAGSYTPFLQVVLVHEPLWSTGLLTFIWTCCLLGICVEAFLPTWKHKGYFALAMYLGMGWSALVCLPEVARLLDERAIHLMVLGGVGYTVGVPFFVRNNNLDHAIWHLFVLAGSIFHWCGIYFYVASY